MNEIFKKNFFNQDFLDKSEKLNKKISVVIPTFNRPIPLKWCIDSLISQKNIIIDEIIVVSDLPNLQIKELVESHNSLNVKIKYIETETRLGSSILRNIGINEVSNEFFLFSDDDCIFSKYSVFGMLYSYNYLKEKNIKVGAVQIPVYNRSIYPREIISFEEIGKIDFENAILNGNFDCFPKEYLNFKANVFCNLKNKILKPFPIDRVKGVFICRKEDYIKAGGFPDHCQINPLLHYGDEHHFSLRLKKIGLKCYFNPDLKFRVFHLKYGLNSGYEKENIPDELIDFVIKSDFFKEECGWRVTTEDWYYSKIMGFYILCSVYKNKGKNWKHRSYQDFVIKNDINFGRTLGKYIQNHKKRLEIWKKAINDGEKIIYLTKTPSQSLIPLEQK